MSTIEGQFWDRLDEINVGMLGVSREARRMPMSHYADPENKCLWFITAKGTPLADAVANGTQEGQYLVCSDHEGLYAQIAGELSLSEDSDKLNEFWNAVASSWFEDGKRDPDIRLLKFRLVDAEVWTSTGSMAFLYEIAKANVTGDKPDVGEHGTLTF